MFTPKKKHSSEWWHYLILALGLGLMVVLYSVFYHQAHIAFGIVVLTTAFYLTWAFLHHHLTSYHHPKILLEYMLVALLGLGLAISVILSL